MRSDSVASHPQTITHRHGVTQKPPSPNPKLDYFYDHSGYSSPTLLGSPTFSDDPPPSPQRVLFPSASTSSSPTLYRSPTTSLQHLRGCRHCLPHYLLTTILPFSVNKLHTSFQTAVPHISLSALPTPTSSTPSRTTLRLIVDPTSKSPMVPQSPLLPVATYAFPRLPSPSEPSFSTTKTYPITYSALHRLFNKDAPPPSLTPIFLYKHHTTFSFTAPNPPPPTLGGSPCPNPTTCAPAPLFATSNTPKLSC